MSGVVLLGACGQGSNPPAIPIGGTLDAEVVTRDPAIGHGDHLAVTGKFLWLTDAQGDPFLHLVDLSTGRVVRSFGRRGEGPGEFQSAQRIFPVHGAKNQVLVYDPQLRRLTGLAVDTVGTITIAGVSELRELSPFPRQLGSLGTGFVGWLADSNPRWIILDSALVTSHRTPGPLVGPSEVDWRVRSQASANLVICGSPSGDRFGVVYGSASRIELHARDGALLRLAETPDTTDGEFVPREGGGGQLRWERSQYHYSGCAGTSEILVALYSGRPEGRPEDVAWAGDALHVFGWDGNLVRIHPVDARLTRIATDQSGSNLYGVGVDGSTVHRIALPEDFVGVAAREAP